MSSNPCGCAEVPLDAEFKRGDTWTIVTVFWETDAMLSKVPFPEGTSASAHLRNRATNALVLEATSCTVDHITSSVTTVFSAADTEGLPVNATYVMDVQVTYADGSVGSTADLYISAFKDRTFA